MRLAPDGGADVEVGKIIESGCPVRGIVIGVSTDAYLPPLQFPRKLLVRMIGLEPTLPRGNWNLNPARLPISPHPHCYVTH